jgi:uncharacterized SAM-binding protein YcdF (DUF218 family)
MPAEAIHHAPIAPPAALRPRRRWRRVGIASLLLASTLGAGYIWREPLLASFGNWMNVGERLQEPVDYAFVLGGNAHTRAVMAGALYRDGHAKRILLPQVEVPPEVAEGLALPEREVTRRILLAGSVPVDAIDDLAGEVTSTRDEAKVLARFLSEHPDVRVAVVTNDFHTRRARMLFLRQVLPQYATQLHFVAAPTNGFGPDNWWKLNTGVNTYVTEFAKLCRDCVR